MQKFWSIVVKEIDNLEDMHIEVKIILKLLKKGDIRKLTEIMCHRTEAEKWIVILQKVQFFLSRWMNIKFSRRTLLDGVSYINTAEENAFK